MVILITPHIVSGKEFVAYEPLIKDEDFAYIDSFEQARNMMKPTFESYRSDVLNKIKSAAIDVGQANSAVSGEIEVTFILNPDGSLKQEPQVGSSESRELRDKAIESIKKALPFPPFPKGTVSSEERFSVTLEFK